jgi:hypothetical protein
MKSQIILVVFGLPRENHFPINSLTRRELLTGPKTCLFKPIGLKTYFFNPSLLSTRYRLGKNNSNI